MTVVELPPEGVVGAFDAVTAAGPAPALRPDERDAVARGLAASFAAPVDDLDDAPERRWWRIVATDTFDAWLIDWPVGTDVRPHDHGGAAASICVVRGTLTETVLAAGDGGTVASRSTLVPGGVHRVASDAVHDVTNDGPDRATSVHVYSPPLRTMLFYDRSGTPTQLDRVEPEPVLWSTDLP